MPASLTYNDKHNAVLTNTNKYSGTGVQVGNPIGLLLALTYAVGSVSLGITYKSKTSSVSLTNINKS